MILTHGSNSINSIPTEIIIDGRLYHTTKIGSQLWITDPIKVDSVTHKTRNGYDCYYYQWESLQSISNILPTNWRIPSLIDANILKAFVEDRYGNDTLYALKSITWNGTNSSGFNARDFGYYYQAPNESERWVDDRCNLWTTTFYEYVPDYGKNRYYDIQVRDQSYNFSDTTLETQWLPIYIMKDI